MPKSKKFTPPAGFQISPQSSQRLLVIQSEIDDLLRDETSTLNKLKQVRSTIQDLRDEERRLIRKEDPTGTLFEEDEEEEEPEKPAAEAKKPKAEKKPKKGAKGQKELEQAKQRPAIAEPGTGKAGAMQQPATSWLKFEPSKRLKLPHVGDLLRKLGVAIDCTLDDLLGALISWVDHKGDEKLDPYWATCLGQLRMTLEDNSTPKSQLQVIDSRVIHLRDSDWPEGSALAEFEELMELMASELDEEPETDEGAAQEAAAGAA